MMPTNAIIYVQHFTFSDVICGCYLGSAMYKARHYNYFPWLIFVYRMPDATLGQLCIRPDITTFLGWLCTPVILCQSYVMPAIMISIFLYQHRLFLHSCSGFMICAYCPCNLHFNNLVICSGFQNSMMSTPGADTCQFILGYIFTYLHKIVFIYFIILSVLGLRNYSFRGILRLLWFLALRWSLVKIHNLCFCE